eukprot:7375444-Pyramimonas_sp.AAC.2
MEHLVFVEVRVDIHEVLRSHLPGLVLGEQQAAEVRVQREVQIGVMVQGHPHQPPQQVEVLPPLGVHKGRQRVRAEGLAVVTRHQQAVFRGKERVRRRQVDPLAQHRGPHRGLALEAHLIKRGGAKRLRGGVGSRRGRKEKGR